MGAVMLDFAGTAVPAIRGETVAAALTRAGVRALRHAPDGSPHGLFCGMGVCQDCVLDIDGIPGRACMTAVTGPHRVVPGGVATGAGFAASLPPLEFADIPVRTPDVLVIGGGVAGLSAAAAAAEGGAAVVLIDERSRLGGQYFKQPADLDPDRDDGQFAAGRALIARALLAGVQVHGEAAVWAAVPERNIAVVSSGGMALYRPAALVVATGAYERALPLPGWTLPGVITTGAAQSLLRGEGVVVGRRVLVCGHGPLNLQVAVELCRRGAEVVAVAELAAGFGGVGALWRMATSTPSLLWQGAAMRAELRRRGVALLHGHVLRDVRRHDHGLLARLATLPSRPAGREFAVDVVCMGYGFQPANEILRGLDCQHYFDAQRHQLTTDRDRDGGTSVAGVYAAGDCCGLGGARAAGEEGLIAGAAAAAFSGHEPPAALASEVAAARRRLARHRAFQRGLWRLYQAPHLDTDLATPDTPICRCEGVTLGVVEAAMEDCEPSIGAVKRLTRAGMGACQGRYCAPILAAMLARRAGRRIDEFSFFAPRAPIKPVTIAELSRLAAP